MGRMADLCIVNNLKYDIYANKYLFHYYYYYYYFYTLLLFPVYLNIFIFFAHLNNYRSLFGFHPANRDRRVFYIMQSIVNPFAHCSTLISDLLCQRSADIICNA